MLTIAPSATGILVPTQDDGSIAPHDAASVIDACVIASDCLVIGPGMGAGSASGVEIALASEPGRKPVCTSAQGIPWSSTK